MGDCFPPPPAICQTSGPIIYPKMSFYSPGLQLSGYIAKLYVKATDDVTDRIKCQFCDYPSLSASPGKAAVSNWNKADGTTWIMSGILLSIPLTLCDLVSNQCHPRSKKMKLKFWVWMVWSMFLGQIFVRKAKNDPRFFEYPKADRNEKSEMCLNPRK